ncbi:hypothetical protein [Marinifilum breve]|nr:hypothetical protein [Marinifilum breve]
MNLKSISLTISLCFTIGASLFGQEVKLPLEMKFGHLCSEWKLHDSIQAKVFLETGFPKIVINQKFAQNKLSDLKSEKASKDAAIALWGQQNKIKILSLIKDTLKVNGNNVMFDALVADFSTIKSWKNYDIIYPLRDLSGAVEINLSDSYMIVDKNLKTLSPEYIKFEAKTDDKTKGLYINTSLKVYDSLNTNEELKGNFLLDLGAPNAIFVNRNLPEVERFVSKSDRLLLKDTTKFRPNPRTKLAIIMPDKFQIGNIYLTKNFVVAMKMFKSNKSSKYVGMIGNKFFANFNMIFDFKNSEIYMKPTSENVTIE